MREMWDRLLHLTWRDLFDYIGFVFCIVSWTGVFFLMAGAQ